jgi:SAM-dependent methyltransferase
VSTAGFDAYASRYSETVNSSVRFAGGDVEFFARSKAVHLLRMARRLRCPAFELQVLDVGCGTGLTDRELLPHVKSLTGVDVSTEMVDQAGRKNLEASYSTYDGRRLPFEDGQFDLVFAACVVHHVDPAEWGNLLSELWRVTAAGGAAVVIEHNPLNPFTRRAVRACPFDEDAVLARRAHLCRLFSSLHVDELVSRFITFFPVDNAIARRAELALGWLPLGAQYMVAALKHPVPGVNQPVDDQVVAGT